MSLEKKKRETAILTDLANSGFGPVTVDDFLGGQVRLIQLEAGYRAGQDAVLLAASIKAYSRDVALDLGAGTGGAAICLARRCPGVVVDGLEIQEELATLADRNTLLNDLGDRVEIRKGSVVGDPEEIPENFYNHVFANPPYLDEEDAIAPATDDKKIAHVRVGTRLEDWVKFALSRVKDKGTVTFIYRADHADELIRHLSGRVGGLVVFPLWPREGAPAKRVIIQGRKGLGGKTTFAPGICLHGTNERYSKDAEAILREGKPLMLS